MVRLERGVVFRVLGPLEVSVDGRVLELGSVQVRLVLAALLADANVVVSVDRLVEVLWGDEPPASASSSVQKLVYRLRVLLGPGAEVVVMTLAPGYVVRVVQENFDAARFEGLLVDARDVRRDGDAAAAVALLDGALGLWRGPAFGEFAFAEFARAEAARLEELRWVAIEERVEARLTLGAHEELVGELETLVSESGFRERLWGELMLALYRSGRQAEALRAYGRVRSLLGEEFGIEPGVALRSLEVAMLLQQPDLDWVPVASSAPPQVTDVVVDGLPSPSGTVTFVFTDLDDSTRLWEGHPSAMNAALARHDEILRSAVEAHAGLVVKATGDGVHAAFATAHDALQAAVEAQLVLMAEDWGGTGELRVRMGVHTGSAERRDGDYFGAAVNRAARVMGAAHGGQVVVSLATEELVRDVLPDNVALVDLGEHRLRDLARPERLFQLVHPDLLRKFAPLRSLDRPASDLPAAQTSFVGRERELVALREVLRDARLVTLIGVGGVGKTRLALEAAAEMAGEFRDGAVFCELASLMDQAAVPDAVASRLEVRLVPDIAVVDSIVATLARREMLVVLDNCEHVLDAAGVLADAMVRSCPGVTVLATSREGLGIDAEVLRPIRSLSMPDDNASIEEVAATESARLFAARAVAVRPEFVVDAATGPAVGDICRQLDGVPLAIELAAARVGSLTVREIADRLDQRFRLLTGGRRTALERHQTLRNTVDWSYELLDEAEARVFDRLSVFAGGFTLNAAEAVVSGDGVDSFDVLDLVGHLVAQSMVIADDSGGTTRYRLLDTMRQYARERLDETADADAWRARHADYFLELAGRAATGSRGSEELRWAKVVATDLANFRAVLDWSVATGEPDDALRLCLALAPFSVRLATRTVSGWFAVALAVPDGEDRELRARVAAWNAWSSGFTSRLERFREQVAVMEQAYRVAGIPLDAQAFAALATLAGQEGRLQEAVDRFDDALAVTTVADIFHRSFFLAMRANVLSAMGMPDDAVDSAERAVAAANECGSISERARADAALGSALADVDPERAILHLERSQRVTPRDRRPRLRRHQLAFSSPCPAPGRNRRSPRRARRVCRRARTVDPGT